MNDSFKKSDSIETRIYDCLKTVIDPEIGINIIDLALVYRIAYSEEEGIQIELTFSTKGCPMGDVITDAIKNVIAEKFPKLPFTLELVWEPVWTTDMVTNDGRKELGM